jgi:hypothetical protein
VAEMEAAAAAENLQGTLGIGHPLGHPRRCNRAQRPPASPSARLPWCITASSKTTKSSVSS